MQADLLKKSSRRICTAEVVWSIVLRAAAQMISIYAACLDLQDGPSDQAVFDALAAGLPKTLSVLERRLNEALTNYLPRSMRRRAWHVAIDWHLVPYYGEPQRSKNELYYGKPRQGTKNFHAYATACIVVHGQRYTLALSWVRRHETTVTAHTQSESAVGVCHEGCSTAGCDLVAVDIKGADRSIPNGDDMIPIADGGSAAAGDIYGGRRSVLIIGAEVPAGIALVDQPT